MNEIKKKNTYGENLLKILVFLTVSIILFLNLNERSKIIAYHTDEYDYVARGIFFEYFNANDFSNWIWQTYDSYAQEKLPSYYYQMVLKSFNVPPLVEKTNPFPVSPAWISQYLCKSSQYSLTNCQTVTQNWLYHYTHNIQSLPANLKLELQTIDTARKGALLFSTGSLLIFFLIVSTEWGFVVGILGILILYSNPLFQIFSLRAMGDSPLLFFSLAGLAVTQHWGKSIRKISPIKSTLYILALGLLSGLAMASKLNGALSLITLYIVAFSTLMSAHSHRNKLLILLTVIATTVVAIGIFIILNPFTWRNPALGILFMVQHRIKETAIFQSQFPSLSLHTIPERLYSLLSSFLYHPVFPGGDTEETYYVSPIFFCLFVIGFVKLILNQWSMDIKTQLSSRFILLYSFTIWIIMGIYLGVQWDRYYLPFLPAITLIQSLGVSVIFRLISKSNRFPYRLSEITE